MKTVEQIMGLAGTYAYLSETQDANGRAFDEAEVALRTAIEELAADANRYQFLRKIMAHNDGNNESNFDKELDASMEKYT